MKKPGKKRNRPGLVQISFKVPPDIAQQLDTRAKVASASRHCVARLLVSDGLSRSETSQPLSVAAQQPCMAAGLEQALAAVADQLNALASLCERIDERFSVQETRLVDAQQDFANGVFALLVQTGKPQEQAEAFVRSHLHLPPRSS